MKQQKLLNKILRYYLGYGLLPALIIIPVFYFLMKQHHLCQVDEFLLRQKEEIVSKSLRTLKKSEIPAWNLFNNERAILPDTEQSGTDIYTSGGTFHEPEKGNKPYRILYSRIRIEGEQYILAIRGDISGAQEILGSASLLMILLLVILAAGLLLITHLLSPKLWSPYLRTLSLAEQFDIRHNEAPHFPPTGIQEFDQLNHALEKLIDHNLEAYRIQKEFTENASHEMLAPLTIFRSKLDMLLQQPGLTGERSSVIRTLHDATSRLVRMNKNLLLLSQMNNLEFTDTQDLNVSEIVEESLSSLSAQAEATDIVIEAHIHDRLLTLQANKTLLKTLVDNLLTNAVRHNEPEGKISIMLEHNKLTIFNTGPEHILNHTVLYRRFGRMNPAANGSGLGLAIARQICTLNDWQISYAFISGWHQFTVIFNHLKLKPNYPDF